MRSLQQSTPVKKVEFRFYEELNDFLRPEKRKKTFVHFFRNNPSVKDMVESLGVPHVEIDLILANSEPVSFRYHVMDGDRISVYPRFETFDISGIKMTGEPPLRTPCFVLDVHLGRLAHYLRMLGFDTLYQNDSVDEDLVKESVLGKRILLTRDRELLKHEKLTHGLWLRSPHPKEQAKEIIHRLDLTGMIKPFTRCMECNGLIEVIDKPAVVKQVKPGTIRTFEEFFRCTLCNQVYWKGAHFHRMEQTLSELVENRIKSVNEREPHPRETNE